MNKRPKLKPEFIHTREGMETAVAEYVRASLEHTGLQVKIEEEKASVEKKHAAALAELAQQVELKFASVQNYCALHRRELLPDEAKKKSFETNTATVGFADNPHALDKSSSETWEQIARRLLGLTFNAGTAEELHCAMFVEEKPVLKKDPLRDAILAGLFKPQELRALGLTTRQEERFYITPKSELLETDSKAA